MESSGRFKRDAWYDQYAPYEKVQFLIWDVALPTACVFGLFGNFMIMLIMHRLPASTSSAFFQVLAWSDQLMLIISPLCSMISVKFKLPDIATLGPWQCKVSSMITYMTAALSPWMLVALSTLRAASVLWPLCVNAVWTKRMSRVTAGVVTVVMVLIHCHFPYGYGIGTCGFECCDDAVSENYKWFIDEVWPWIDMMECNFIPFLLLGISNCVLLWTLTTGARLPVQQTAQDSRKQKVTSLTVTLIATSIAFFLLTTSMTVYLIVSPYADGTDPLQIGQYDVFQTVATNMVSFNSSVNFYLYCLTGAKFRAEFKKIVFQFFGLFHKAVKSVRDKISLTNNNDAIW